MKAILISIQPKWVAKILNGEKTIEVRKSFPKCDLPIDVYIYCTKDSKKHLYPVALLDKHNKVFKRGYKEDDIDNRTNYLNGKVVAKFTLNKVEEIICDNDDYGLVLRTKTMWHNQLLRNSCLNEEEMIKYLPIPKPIFADDRNTKVGYAWHIDNLVIFDKPKELSEFKISKIINVTCNLTYLKSMHTIVRKPLTKAPQSWCYIESEE